MRYLFLGAAALLFIASAYEAHESYLFSGDGIHWTTISLAMISLGLSIAGGLALVAAAIYKGDA